MDAPDSPEQPDAQNSDTRPLPGVGQGVGPDVDTGTFPGLAAPGASLDQAAGSVPVPADRRLGAPPANSPRFIPAPPSPASFPASSVPTPAPPTPVPASAVLSDPGSSLPPPGPPAPPVSGGEPAASPPPPSPQPTRRGAGIFLGVMAAVLAAALVATGFALARATDDDSPVVADDPRPVIATVPDQTDDQPAPDIDPTGEPVADVARVVAPSVVLVQVDQFGQGSGIAYSASLIVTNAHVVGESSAVSIQLNTGQVVDGTVVGTDPDRDVAVIEVAGAPLEPASFADSSSVEVGQLAVAVGSPFGLDQTVTSGVVSAVDRVVDGGLDGANPVTMVQTDAPINPGNSGGALVDKEGRIIGMNTAIRTDTGNFAGVGFAIPSDTITLIAERLVNGESLDFAFLGVSMENAQGDVVGALIVEVEDDSPAATAGLESGDIVIRLDSSEITDRRDLAAKVRLKSPGEDIELEFVRNGQNFVVALTLGQN